MEALHRFPGEGAADDGVSAFVKVRSRMLAAAFRTLRDAAEAEDIVQDAWLRWQNVDREGVRNAPAFLKATTVRLAINRATGARTRHEQPLAHSLAEPVDPGAGPGTRTEQGQAVERALLLLLERLSPNELAAYVLREAFSYSYRQISCVAGVSVANSRQLVTRARKRLMERPRAPVEPAEFRRIVGAFIEATQRGDLGTLEAVLSAEIAAKSRKQMRNNSRRLV
jgi:RNA polymerase sigma-70 factor, ECF subfamily